MAKTILMGCWDCASCGKRGVRGDSYECDGCGSGRPENVKFYLPTNAEVVRDAAGIRAATAGSDWQCPYCDEWNPATIKDCKNCAGGDIGSSKRQTTRTVVTKGRQRSRAFDQERPESLHDEFSGWAKERPHAWGRDHADPPKRRTQPKRTYTKNDYQRQHIERALTSMRDPKQLLWYFGGVLLFGLVLLAIFYTSEVQATISHHSWGRVQHTEVFRTGIKKDGWSHPADAYEVWTSEEVHHYVQVACGSHEEPVYDTRTYDCGTEYCTRTVDLGNGRFSSESYACGTRTCTESYQSGTRSVTDYCDEPVYDTYYHYKVDRWVGGPDRNTDGVGLEPKWPGTSVSDPSKERMAGREGTYRLHFLESGPPKDRPAKQYQTTLPEKAWYTWEDGESVILDINVAGGVRAFRRPEVEKE